MTSADCITVFVAVEAKPPETFRFAGREKVEGYYQTIGLTARDEPQLLCIIKQFLEEDLGSSLVDISERWPPDFEGIDADVRAAVGDLNSVGIWYSSGRAWFGLEPD